MTYSIIIILVALAGFSLASYMRHKKTHKNEHFVCPLKANCRTVIHSNYSKFFGIRVELLGMLYYGLLVLGYLLRITYTDQTQMLGVLLLLMTVFAFMFSLYLTFVQIAALRQFCSWCLLSASFCTIILISAIYGSAEISIPFIEQYKSLITSGHVLAMALGLGAATLADVFFMKFLKDLKISEHEASVLQTITEFIWFALGVIVMTGLALFLPQSGELLQSSKFLIKVFIVSVIIVNGAFLNLKVAPELVKISFGETHEHEKGELRRARKLAFMLGPISIVSWYSAFALGMMGYLTQPLELLLLIYLLIIITAITVGGLLEESIKRRG